MPRIQVRNRLLTNERVSGATVAVVGQAGVTGVTNNQGIVDLNTAGLPDRVHTLRVTPANTTADPVGPNTASGAAPAERIYRSLDVQITTRTGNITAVNIIGGIANGTAALGNNPRVTVDLQPVWMRSPFHGARGSALSIIIVHHTGGAAIQGALNEWLHGADRRSVHYVIDHDGQIVKLVQDDRRANHAGEARWHGSDAVNSASIGIEIVHRTEDGNYPEAQYTALLGLLDRLLATHTGIDRRDIIGHSDVGTNNAGRLGRKSTDPGMNFEWARLERRNFGLVPAAGPFDHHTLYGGFFHLVPGGSFRRNDNDNRRRFGGANRPAVTGTPIDELQDDLSRIGYSVGTPDGDFGERTHWAVQMFQEHFFAGGRVAAANGQVDVQTAEMIKRVVT